MNGGAKYKPCEVFTILGALERRSLKSVAAQFGRTPEAIRQQLKLVGVTRHQGKVTRAQAAKNTGWSYHTFVRGVKDLRVGFFDGTRCYLSEEEVAMVSKYLAETLPVRITPSERRRKAMAEASRRNWSTHPSRLAFHAGQQSGCGTLIRLEVRGQGTSRKAYWLVTCHRSKRDRWVALNDLVRRRYPSCRACGLRSYYSRTGAVVGAVNNASVG